MTGDEMLTVTEEAAELRCSSTAGRGWSGGCPPHHMALAAAGLWREIPWASSQMRGEEKPVCQLNMTDPVRGYIQYVNCLAKTQCSKTVPKGYLIEAKRALLRAKADSRNWCKAM